MSRQESATRLFQFLKQFSELKTKKIRDVDQFEKVFWFCQTPKEKETFSLTDQLTNASGVNHYDKWIEIKKPRIPADPTPPPIIENWIWVMSMNRLQH